METNQTPKRLHPLIIGAAASVMLVSLAGTAAITGILPSSHGAAAPAVGAPVAGLSQNPVPLPAAAAAPARDPAVEYGAPRHVIHHPRVAHHTVMAQAAPVDYAPAPQLEPMPPAPRLQQPAPVAQNSAIGIGVGAVLGGLLGHQIGGGSGRTLATIAGAVGGGYVGNEIAKRNP
jgi:uncharacterized protein YcfJ